MTAPLNPDQRRAYEDGRNGISSTGRGYTGAGQFWANADGWAARKNSSSNGSVLASAFSGKSASSGSGSAGGFVLGALLLLAFLGWLFGGHGTQGTSAPAASRQAAVSRAAVSRAVVPHYAWVTPLGINLMSRPDDNSEVAAFLPHGLRVQIIGTTANGWSEVTAPDSDKGAPPLHGFANSSFLSGS